MSRAVALWIGKTDDTRAPPRVRLRVFLREGGICFLSKRPIAPGENWECHHRTALINGGRNSEDNLVPVLVSAHRAQTKLDVAEKSHVADRAKSHFGAKSRPVIKIKSPGFSRSERTLARQPKTMATGNAIERRYQEAK